MKTTLINAGPTKRFFVEMLTRDIELADAILDLLDNCVDGIVRDLIRKNEAITNRSPYQRNLKSGITVVGLQKISPKRVHSC